MEKQKQAYLYAIAAVLIWSTVASAFKISLRYIDVLQLLFHACLVSIFILFALLVVQNKLHLLKTLPMRAFLQSAFLGLLNPFLYYTVLFKAYTLLPAQEAQALNYTWPVMLVLLSIPLLKQKITIKNLVAILISFTGVLVISTRGQLWRLQFDNATGVALALGSAIIWAVFWIYNIRDRRDAILKLFLNFSFGMIFILMATVVYSEIRLPPWRGIFGVIYIGLFEMGITFVIWSQALRLAKTTASVSNFIYLVPFLSLAVIHLLVGETILLSTVVGLVFIVAGIILQHFNRRVRYRSASEAPIS